MIVVYIGLHALFGAGSKNLHPPHGCASSPHVVIMGTPICLPIRHTQDVPDLGFLVSATEPALKGSLAAAGLVVDGSVFDDGSAIYRFAMPPAAGQNIVWQQLRVQRLEHAVDNRILWWLAPMQTRDTATATTCEAAANEPWTLMLTGLTDVQTLPVQQQQTSAPQQLRWLMVRHAAFELNTKADGAQPHGAACGPAVTEPQAHVSSTEVADTVVWHSAAHGKRLALTFDACSTYGYGPFNPAVIKALQTANVPATLFVGGHWAELHGDELQHLARDPLFEIGNHTYSHPHMRDLTPEQQSQELLWTQELIFDRTGVRPRMFRPPYGEVDDTMLEAVANAGLFTVEYDLPAGDADVHVSPARLRQWVVQEARPGSIVIMHMNRPKNHTAQALPDIVADLRRRGFVFCQVSDLILGDGAGCR